MRVGSQDQGDVSKIRLVDADGTDLTPVRHGMRGVDQSSNESPYEAAALKTTIGPATAIRRIRGGDFRS